MITFSILKSWLFENVFRGNKMNPNRCNQKWFQNNGFDDKLAAIESFTNFLEAPILSQRIYCIVNNITEYPLCDCGNKLSYVHNKFQKFCSYKCSNKVTANRSDIVARRKATNIKKYGVENPLSNPEIFNKGVRTFRNKTGLKHPSLVKYVNLDVDLAKRQFLDEGLNLQEIANLHGCSSSLVGNRLKAIGIDPKAISRGRMAPSAEERIVCRLLDNIDVDYQRNVNLGGGEIDILIPSINCGIEVDGCFYHSEYVHRGSARNMHLKKDQYYQKQGIRIIHFWDDEINNKIEIVKSIIETVTGKDKINIFARKCLIREITSKEASVFENENHIQGYHKSRFHYGLFDRNNTLVMTMSFSKSRFSTRYEYEITRLCTKIGYSCVGGASKLFKHFIEEQSPLSIVSYCDKRLFEGAVYKKLGMSHSHDSAPNYFYQRGNTIESRMKYQKHKLKNLLAKFDPQKSEWENMQAHGFSRVWDCGNSVWTWSAGS